MKAVILAGGLGTRLSEETDRMPKPLVEVGGRPILWHIMKCYSRYDINDFIICLGYKGYLLKEYFSNYSLHMCDVTFDIQERVVKVHEQRAEPWRVTLVDTGLETQTGGRLRRVRKHIGDESFCFTYGDGLSDVDIGALVAFHRASGRLATVTAIRQPGRFGVLRMEGDRVVGFAEKAAQGASPINGGFFVLEPRAIDYIEGDATVWEREPMERLAEAGQLAAYRHEGFWRPMDTLREKRELDELWHSGQAPWKVWE